MLLHIGRFYLYDFQPKIKCVFLLCHTAYFFGCFVCFSIVIMPIFIHFHLSYFTLNLKLYKQHCSILTVCILCRWVFSILLLRRLFFVSTKNATNAWFRITVAASSLKSLDCIYHLHGSPRAIRMGMKMQFVAHRQLELPL